VIHRLLPCCLAILLLVGCAPANLASYRPANPDEAQIASVLMRIPNGIKSRSVELILQAYADDLYVGNFHKYLGVASRGTSTSIRKADIPGVYTQLFRASKELSLLYKQIEMTVSGDRATVTAVSELSIQVEAGRGDKREPEIVRNDVLWRLTRTPLGWKVKEEIYN